MNYSTYGIMEKDSAIKLGEEEIALNNRMDSEAIKKIFHVISQDMKELIQGHSFKIDDIGCSGAHIVMFDNELVLKVEHKKEESDGEYQMMSWLEDKLPVPKIVKFHTDGNYNYLLMTKVKGKMACEPNILVDGENVAKLLAKGLKMLWQTDTKSCPRTVDLNFMLVRALDRIKHNMVKMESNIFGVNGFESPMALYKYLRDNRPEEETVLVHGDYCLPNIFIEEHNISGYLDLGYCGVGDKWQDIAFALRSLHDNLKYIGKEEEYPLLYRIFMKELGIEVDEAKIRYYILLDELF